MDKQDSYFISLPIGLASKLNNKWKKIYHLSDPNGCLVNCHIPKDEESLKYTTFDKANNQVINRGPSYIMLKRDLKDAVGHISIVKRHLWLWYLL